MHLHPWPPMVRERTASRWSKPGARFLLTLVLGVLPRSNEQDPIGNTCRSSNVGRKVALWV